MILQLTNAGVAALQASTSPITLGVYRLGSAYNYTPSPTDTSIHGQQIWSGAPSAPIPVNANLVKYSIYLDYDIGPFEFGEVGLFMQNGNLFALGAANELWKKLKLSATNRSNSIRLDLYLSSVGQNYEMWLDSAETNNQFRLAVFGSPDFIPPSQNATPNAYVIGGATSDQSAFLAYTDRNGLWNFDCYQYATTMNGSVAITGATSTTVTIAASDFNPELVPLYEGHKIVEFTTGRNYSICRYVKSAVQSGSTVTITFFTPMAVLPSAGDRFILFSRTALASSNVKMPVATTSSLGAVIVGAGLAVQPDGTLSVNTNNIPGGLVYSVNGQQGDVTLGIEDIANAATVARTGSYNDLTDKPAAYVLPIANETQLGGVKASSDGTITVASDGTLGLGFDPVTSINGYGGAVSILGLIDPKVLNSGDNLNSLPNSGLFYVMTDVVAQSLQNGPTPNSTLKRCVIEVIPLGNTASASGDCIVRWVQDDRVFVRSRISNAWSPWVEYINLTTLPIATTSVLGAVKVGDRLSVTPDGTLSADEPPIATTSVLGVVKVGNRLSVTADGTLSADNQEPPIATTSTVGVVRVGSGLSITAQGVLSANDQGGTTPQQVDEMITARLGGVNRTTLTGSGNFTVPDGVTSLLISGCAGGGGGGGAGGGNSTVDISTYPGRSGGGGGGGGAGQAVQNLRVSVTPGQIIPYSIGTGGNGGTGGTPGNAGTNGTAGGATTFGSFVNLTGGAPGVSGNGNTGSNPDAGAGGAGGNQGGTDGDDGFHGGAGGAGGSGVFGFGGGRTRGGTSAPGINGKNASGFGCGGGGGAGVYAEGGDGNGGTGGNGSPGTLIIDY